MSVKHRSFHRLGRPALASAGLLSLMAGAAFVVPSSAVAGSAAQSQESADSLPESLTLVGTVRDFRKHGVDNGHPDFQRYNTGHAVEWVEPELDADGKPVAKSIHGRKLSSNFRNEAGRNIMPALYDSSLGDQAGSFGSDVRVITSPESFAQWYRDVPGVNLSMAYPITLRREQGTNKYVFHLHDDRSTAPREGFFPADGELFGDVEEDWGHNFHFTFELETEFMVEKGTGQYFTFYGDDDVWVFVNGRMVIDIGGVHGAVNQTIDIDRLDWLADGERATLKLFFAERHTTRSNFRVETSLRLRTVTLPQTAGLYD